MRQHTLNQPVPMFDWDWCQRWRNGRDSWRSADLDDRFQPHRYQVVPLDELTARAFTTENHYSRSWPAAKLRYGLIQDGTLLAGTAVLGVPMRPEVLTNPFPAFEPYTQSIELSRFVLLDEVPANGESWFLSRVFRNAAEQGIRGVVAYSDPVPRVIDGHPLMPGHVGICNQATGGVYFGRGRARKLTVLPDGRVLSDRTRSKILNEEQGSAGAIAQLVALGADPKPDAMPGREWLGYALVQLGARQVEHPGNHRYGWSIGPRWSRRAYPVALPVLPYPKQPDLIGLSA